MLYENKNGGKFKKSMVQIQIESDHKTHLSQKVTKSPSNKRSACLGSQWMLVQCIIIGGPSRNGTSANFGGVTEEWAVNNRVLAECWLGQGIATLLLDWVRRNTKGGGNRKQTKEGKKLHFVYV